MINTLSNLFLSKRSKRCIEKGIYFLAILSFILHLILIYLKDFKSINIADPDSLLLNPISAIYTPFSFIILYEIYLLIYYLPKSITTYVVKQYEIITLIMIRKVFKDISIVDFAQDIVSKSNLQILIDTSATLLLFFLIYLFNLQIIKSKGNLENKNNRAFINVKKYIAISLIPIFSIIGIINLYNWIYSLFDGVTNSSNRISNLDNIFFEDFFQLLIIIDVLLLIVSLFNSEKFYSIVRNSGFIISTILIRLSFITEGIYSTLLIIFAIVFGLIIQIIYKLFYYQKSLE